MLEYSISGSEDARHVVVQENRCELTDLAMGTVYSFSAKVILQLILHSTQSFAQVVTTAGKSQFSNMMPLKTKFTQTEMGQFKDEVYGNITLFCSFLC